MSNPMVWDTTIADTDLVAAPTAPGDANAVDTVKYISVGCSVVVSGGSGVVVTVATYFHNTSSNTYEKTGDTFDLDPATSNLKVLNPNGLALGFTATATGSPTSFNIHVGRRR